MNILVIQTTDSGVYYHRQRAPHIVWDESGDEFKDDGTPYKVYTPYSKKWVEALKNNPIKNYNSESHLSRLVKTSNLFSLTLEDIGFNKSKQKISSYDTTETLINQYEATRNFPAKNKDTSNGCISSVDGSLQENVCVS